MAEIIVARWVNEKGRQTRKWYWEVRLGGSVRAAGIVKAKDAAWQRGVEELALCAYQRGMADALDGQPADAGSEATSWPVALAAIDTLSTACAQCNGPRGSSPSNDFCSEPCQHRWLSARTVDLPLTFDETHVHLEITADLAGFTEALDRVRDYMRRAQYARLPSLPPEEFRRLYLGGSTS